MGAKGLKKSLEETLSDGVMNADYDGVEDIWKIYGRYILIFYMELKMEEILLMGIEGMDIDGWGEGFGEKH